ncbi:MAG: hypothetical protein WDN45_07925 [Caulobacteraceae bacterium]
MDQVTQRNAAMVEQTNAAAASLLREAEDLGGLIARFKMGKRAASRPEAAGAGSRPGRNPVGEAQARIRTFAGAEPAATGPGNGRNSRRVRRTCERFRRLNALRTQGMGVSRA